MRTSRPRVLHVIPGLGLGGAEAFLTRLCTNGASEALHRVVSVLPGEAYRPNLERAGVEVDVLPATSLAAFARAISAIRRISRHWTPDVVQGWMYHGNLAAMMCRASAMSPNAKLLWSIRNAEPDPKRFRGMLRVNHALNAALSRFPDAIVANSVAGRQAHAAQGFRPKWFEVIHNGVDAAAYKPDPKCRQEVRRQLRLSPEARVAIHVGRRHPVKRHELLLEMIGRVPWVRLVLVGAGTEALQLPSNAIALGASRDVAKLLSAADIYVSSSDSEGFPNGVAEAMAAELPSVCTDAGDTKLLVGDSGIVVPVGDGDALGRGVSTILGEEASHFAERKRRARQRIVDHFSLERACRRYAALYQSLLGGSIMPARVKEADQTAIAAGG